MKKTLVACLSFIACGAAFAAGPSQVHFLGVDEARAALTEGPERGFYDHLQLVEMRAKTGLALKGVGLEAARAQAIAAYRDAVLAFTPDEEAALRDATDHLQPVLEASAPLYARTPWSFIKVQGTLEGGMPHTRGDSIVLSAPLLASLVRAHAKGGFGQPSPVWVLLVHEQTHVIQRRHPGLFDPLYTSVLRFRHVDLPPAPAWVAEARMTNPDAPVSEWAFSLGSGASQKWYLPEILVDNGEHPRMPEDFRVVALPIVPQGAAWAYADATAPAKPVALDDLKDYTQRFPIRDELFHPNEIAAGLLSYLLIGAEGPEPANPLWQATHAWAGKALQQD